MKRWISIAAIAVLLAVLPQVLVESPIHARIFSVAGICLLLWIAEVVPPFVPTLLLWAFIPLLLSPIDQRYALPNVLGWSADPVMALFFGGFALGVATDRTGLSSTLTGFALQGAAGSYRKFLLFIMLITAFLSMWISNIAAAALVFASLGRVLEIFDKDEPLRRTLLLGVALSADLGGIATPVGTGPNAIAIASISQTHPVSFVSWMTFAFPLTIGLLVLMFLFLVCRVGHAKADWCEKVQGIVKDHTPQSITLSKAGFLFILIGTVVVWLTEPIHRISAPVVAIAAAGLLFLSRILSKNDLLRIDWSTLFLIAGGLTLGRLLEHAGLARSLASEISLLELNPAMTLFVLCLVTAMLSALMSNTATVVLMIPIATALLPGASTAILVAVSASFGVPFLISTPPNAMAFGRGGLKFGDLFWPGILVMLVGCGLVALTGRWVLNLAGIP